MAISDENEVLYATVSKEDKEELKRLAAKHKRSVSKEAAYAISLYLEQQRKSEKQAQN